MEDDIVINYPYYDTTYLDDNDTKHLVKLQSEKDLNFFRERFTVLSSEYRYEQITVSACHFKITHFICAGSSVGRAPDF